MENRFSRILKVMIHKQLLLFHGDQYCLQQGVWRTGQINMDNSVLRQFLSEFVFFFKIIYTCESMKVMIFCHEEVMRRTLLQIMS